MDRKNNFFRDLKHQLSPPKLKKPDNTNEIEKRDLSEISKQF